MPPPRLALLALITTATSLPAPALEVGAKPPTYLDEKFRADWHQKPLAKVLDDLSAWIEKPVARSAQVTALDTRTVSLADEHKVPLRETLEVLERTQHLHLTVEALRLRVETDEDWRDRNRRQVDLNLRDYGTFFRQRDFVARQLGYQAQGADGAGIQMFSAAPASGHEQRPEASEIIDQLRGQEHHGGMELRGNGNIFMSVTPEEEAETRATLVEMYHAMVRRADWRVTFGTMPAADAPAGGAMARDAADALAARLKDAHALTMTSMNGQRVNAAARADRSYLADADVVAGHLDPKIQVLSTGQSAELRALTGFRCTWVGFHLAWTDPLPDGPAAELRGNGGARAPADASVTLKKDEAGPVTATVSPPAPGQSGETMTLAQPAVWTWQPIGECYLPKGSAMVFVADHPAGRAVIVLEETTP